MTKKGGGGGGEAQLFKRVKARLAVCGDYLLLYTYTKDKPSRA